MKTLKNMSLVLVILLLTSMFFACGANKEKAYQEWAEKVGQEQMTLATEAQSIATSMQTDPEAGKKFLTDAGAKYEQWLKEANEIDVPKGYEDQHKAVVTALEQAKTSMDQLAALVP